MSGLGSVVGGVIVLYVFGVAGLAIVLGKSLPEAALLVIAFLPADFVKAILAGVITAALAKARPQSILSRA